MTDKILPQIIPVEYQIAVFPKDFRIDNAVSVASKLMKMTDLDSDSLSMNPFDMSAPKDIERVSISSPNKGFKLSVSPYKVIFYWINTDKKLEKDNYQFDEEKSLELIKKIFEVLGITIIERIGFITTVIIRDSNPTQTIKESILNTKITDELTNAQLRLVYKTDLKSNSECSTHISINTGYLDQDIKDKVISIIHDLNTNPEKTLQWNLVEIGNFIKEAEEKSNKEDIYSKIFQK